MSAFISSMSALISIDKPGDYDLGRLDASGYDLGVRIVVSDVYLKGKQEVITL